MSNIQDSNKATISDDSYQAATKAVHILRQFADTERDWDDAITSGFIMAR